MLYKLFINYILVKFIQSYVRSIRGKPGIKSKNTKTMNLTAYGLELLAMYLLKKRRIKK